MAYKCSICGANEVEHMGDICELCAIGQDPYASAMQGNSQSTAQHTYTEYTEVQPQETKNTYTPGRGKSRKVLLNGGAAIANTDPYGNSIVPQNDESEVQVYQAGQVPSTQPSATVVNTNSTGTGSQAVKPGKLPICYGIVKNVSIDKQPKSFGEKWFRALFGGIAYTFDDEVTMFQVFPDYSGNALNALGNACDQVLVYGKLNAGAVSENNDVEVYGRRDSNNNIIAKRIVNKASGTTIKPDGTLSVGVVWFLTIVVLALIFSLCSSLGLTGIIWACVIIFCILNIRLVLRIVGKILDIIISIFTK